MLGMKRTLDLAGLNEALSMAGSVGAHSSGCAYRATPTKRNRTSADGFGGGGDGFGGGSGAEGAQTPTRLFNSTDDRAGQAPMASPSAVAAMAAQFPRRGVAGKELDDMLSECVRGISDDKHGGAYQNHHQQHHHMHGERVAACGSEKKYSTDDVREIVKRAVEMREETLRLEYGALMQDKLAQQFSMFTTHNQDFISRQIKGNPFSYVS